MRCILLSKRDRQSLFQRSKLHSDPASFAAHVSLSSHIQLSKNRPLKAVKKSNPRNHQASKPNKQPAHSLIYLERKTSSPAAPPPSFSERTYKRTPPNKSTGQIRKTQKIRQGSEFNMLFRFPGNAGRRGPVKRSDFAHEKIPKARKNRGVPSFGPVPH